MYKYTHTSSLQRLAFRGEESRVGVASGVSSGGVYPPIWLNMPETPLRTEASNVCGSCCVTSHYDQMEAQNMMQSGAHADIQSP